MRKQLLKLGNLRDYYSSGTKQCVQMSELTLGMISKMKIKVTSVLMMPVATMITTRGRLFSLAGAQGTSSELEHDATPV